MTVVILPDTEHSTRDLIEALSAAAGPAARTDVRTGNGGVVTTDDIAYRWLAAKLNQPVPAPAPPAASPAPTAASPAAPAANRAPVRPRKTTPPAAKTTGATRGGKR